MARLTPFGVAVRKLRVEKNLRLLDLADLLEQSTAFLSAVETGRKQIPLGMASKLVRVLHLTQVQSSELLRAEDKTRKEVRVDHRNEDDRELIAAFARRLDDVPDDVLERIKRIVLKSISGEIPFKRKRKGFLVPPLSNHAIRQYSEKVRSIFTDDNNPMLPIIEILEWGMQSFDKDFVFDVRDVTSMQNDEGLVPIGGNTLILRQDVYERACKGSTRDRFTAGHEFAHYLMHRKVGMARTRDDAFPIYRDSEWQADTFAGSLFMSAKHLHLFSDAEKMAQECGVSNHAASVMWAKYQKEGLVR